MPSNDKRNLNVGRVRQPEAHGRGVAKSTSVGDDSDQAPINPTTSGAPTRDTRDNPAPNPDGCAEGHVPLTPKPLPDPSAKRRGDAPRQAGVTRQDNID